MALPYASSAAVAYGDLVKDQLAQERARKASFESRGISVIQTSSAIVTLLFGLVAIITKLTTFQPPPAALGLIPFALIAFVLAAFFGLLVNWPIPYPEPDENQLIRDLESGEWRSALEDAAESAGLVRLETLRDSRRLNGEKETLLVLALASELAGLIFTALIVAAILMA